MAYILYIVCMLKQINKLLYFQTTSSSTWSAHTEITLSITVPAGKKIDVKQLIGTYGPFSVRSSHFYIEETDATDGSKRELSRDDLEKEEGYHIVRSDPKEHPDEETNDEDHEELEDRMSQFSESFRKELKDEIREELKNQMREM